MLQGHYATIIDGEEDAHDFACEVKLLQRPIP